MKAQTKLQSFAGSLDIQLREDGTVRPYIMAHRGVMAHEPENTLRSFRRALADGADLLETDIHFTKDGVAVCLHDPTVDRTTNGSGPIADLTVAEMRRLGVIDNQGNQTDEKIPTLEEFLQIVPVGRGVALEIKDDRVLEPGLAAMIVNSLREADLAARSVVLSFQKRHLWAMQRAAPWLPAGLISMSNYSPFQPFELLGPHPKILYVNRLYLWLAHRMGKFVCPLDPWPEERIGWYLKIGVDALLSNDPAATVEAVRAFRVE